MSLISKKDMGARAAKAAHMAPSIDDRLRQASELVASHPIDETTPTRAPPTALAAVTTAGARLEIATIEAIDVNPFNARKIYRTERVTELASSIAAHGQEVPGIATIRGGRYVLAAGHYRLAALKHLGVKTMALMIQDGLSDRELYTHSYRENAEREGQTSLDNALSWSDLLASGIYATDAEIAVATGVSKSNIAKTMAALKLTAPVLEFIKEDPGAFPFTLLYEIQLYEQRAGSKRALAMARLVKVGDISRKGLQAAREKLEDARERKRKENSRQYKINRDGALIGSLKEWDSGKVALEVVLNDPKDRAALMAELRERFGLQE